MNEHQKTAIQALDQMRGDDTYRAKSAFRHFTPQQMQEEHGNSGKTRAQVIADYESHDKKCDEAIEWVKAQKP